ncbi:hypothetical protein FOZ63_009177, partial [Perkinsus olseni]
MPGDSLSSKDTPEEKPQSTDSEEEVDEGDERIEKEIVSQIDKARRKGKGKSWKDDPDDEYEQEYLASLKSETKQKSYIGAATGGVAAVGTFAVFTSPLAVVGAAAVGAGTAWKYMRDRGQREVKA